MVCGFGKQAVRNIRNGTWSLKFTLKLKIELDSGQIKKFDWSHSFPLKIAVHFYQLHQTFHTIMICCNVGQLLPLKSPHISVLLIFNRWVPNSSRLWLSFLCYIAMKDYTLCVNYHLLNQIIAPWKFNQQKKLHEQRILNGWASVNHKQPQIFLRLRNSTLCFVELEWRWLRYSYFLFERE